RFRSVEDQDELVLLALLQAVGERGRGGLVDDAEHVEARDLTGVLGRLTLGVVEVRGHRDDGVGDGLAQVGLGVLLQLAEHARRRSEEHTSELQSREKLVCRRLLEKKKMTM